MSIYIIFYLVEIFLLAVFRNSNIFVHQLIIFNIFVYVYNSLYYYKNYWQIVLVSKFSKTNGFKNIRNIITYLLSILCAIPCHLCNERLVFQKYLRETQCFKANVLQYLFFRHFWIERKVKKAIFIKLLNIIYDSSSGWNVWIFFLILQLLLGQLGFDIFVLDVYITM